MLSLGLTGGIAAGKSLLTARFRELGAVVVDADLLAREAVAAGTPGLAAVVDRFGGDILLPDGSLDRPRLGAVVFSDAAARESLNAIVHPLVRTAAAALKNGAGPGAVVVQDIPLLVETGQGADFHLVVVVQAPLEERVARMVRDRGMTRGDALARMAAQATDEDRAAAADVVIMNDGTPEKAVTALNELWHGRLLSFAANLAAGVPAPPRAGFGTSGGVDAAAVSRCVSRIKRAVGDMPVDAVPGAAMGGAVQLRIHAGGFGAGHGAASGLAAKLAAAGYFPRHVSANHGQPEELFASADPGCPAVVQVLPNG